MSPEDVLLESISEASFYGDSPELRKRRCAELGEAVRTCMNFYARSIMLVQSEMEIEENGEEIGN